MGNLYRFVEPVLLFLLKKKGRSHGYELAGHLRQYALTDAEIEIAALYRTLRQLEENGCVTSKWDIEGVGPARRLYVLTNWGEQHLQEWLTVLDHMSRSMKRFIRQARSTARVQMSAGGPKRKTRGRARQRRPRAEAVRAKPGGKTVGGVSR